MDYRVVFSPSLSWSHTEAEEVRLLSTRKRERWYILRCLLTVLPSLSRSLCVCVSECVYFSLHSRNAHNYVQRTKKSNRKLLNARQEEKTAQRLEIHIISQCVGLCENCSSKRVREKEWFCCLCQTLHADPFWPVLVANKKTEIKDGVTPRRGSK